MTDDLLYYDEAAALVGCSISAVKQWKSRHYLQPAGRVRGRPVFTAEAVLAADEHARNARGGRHRKDHAA